MTAQALFRYTSRSRSLYSSRGLYRSYSSLFHLPPSHSTSISFALPQYILSHSTLIGRALFNLSVLPAWCLLIPRLIMDSAGVFPGPRASQVLAGAFALMYLQVGLFGALGGVVNDNHEVIHAAVSTMQAFHLISSEYFSNTSRQPDGMSSQDSVIPS